MHRRASARVGAVVVVTNSEVAPGRRVAGVEADGALQHCDGFFIGLGIMRERDTAEGKIVGLFVLGMSAGFAGIRSDAKSGEESLTNFGCDLASHGNEVWGGHGHGVAPNCTVVRDVDGFERDLKD